MNAETLKGFSWSYSALTRFETCPKQYYHYVIAKDVQEAESDAMREGHVLHAAFNSRVQGDPLKFPFKHYERIFAALDRASGEAFGEQKLALNASFQPVAFFSRDAWYRGVVDYVKIAPPKATVLDWKTGKYKPDTTQLELCASLVFAHNPEVDMVKSALVFVTQDKWERAEYSRENLTNIWSGILPRVQKMVQARAEQEFPAQPSGLCKRWCAVVSCPYHGRGDAP